MVTLLQAPAQTSGIKMEGRIVNEKAEAIEFATVLLRQPQDSTLIMGTTTNGSGAYVLSSVKPGTYQVTGQFVGYITESFTIEVHDSNDIRLPDFILKEDTKLLKEVVVLGQRPLIEQEGEKLILNVQNTIIATGGSAIELLTRAPGVSIDQNDQISLNGKAGVA
ncbi:MAG TPA: carboxypeptidase-like regulatory domain-containing protein, partial [Cyclobacteriaceae bacterium]